MVASLGSVPHIWGSTLLTVTLSRLKITQQFVGVVTSLSLIASTVFTIILTRLADIYFGHKLKKLILSLMPFHTIAMIALCVIILLGSPETNYQCKYLHKMYFKINSFRLQNKSTTPLQFQTFLSDNQPSLKVSFPCDVKI
jgi:MFS family permease